jgi:outer membrane murein-binding lipoprotein Lpp
MPRSTAASRAARRRTAAALALGALALAGCASRPMASRTPTLSATVSDDVPAVRAAVTAFVLGEARGEQTVDTLLASGADFIVTGTAATNRPRLAGVPGVGTGSVGELRIQVAGDYAWAIANYSWVGENPAGGEVGRATFILQRLPAGWRIHHVHSSHVARWDR